MSPESIQEVNRRRCLTILVALAGALALVVAQRWSGGQSWILSWPGPAAAAAAILLAAWGLGRRILSRVWPRGSHLAVAPYLAVALGAGSIATLVLVAGLAGILGIPLLTVMLVVLVLPGALDLIRWLGRWMRSPSERSARTLERLAVALPLVVGGLHATLPPVFYDALVYHLGLPNLYLAQGSLLYPESFSLAGYPQYAELIFTLALAVGGEVGVRLTGFLCTVLALLLVRRLAIERFGRLAGNLTYVLLVSQWFVWFQAIFLKVDLIGAFFLLAAFAALFESREEDNARPWVTAGLLAGFAVGIKFTHLLPLVLAAGTLPWTLAAGRRHRWRHAVLLLVLAVAIASPWMLRNTVHRGNPFFPAFYEKLGGTGWSEENAGRMRAETGMNLDRSIVASAQRVARIGWRAGYGSGGEVSRAWLPLLLAGLVFARGKDVRWLLGLSMLGVVLGVVFFSTYLRVHAWAILAVPLAWGALWDRFAHRAARVALVLLLLLVAIPGALTAVRLTELISARGGRVLRGELTPADYLVEQLSYTPVARYINDNLDPSARIRILGSARSAYIHRACTTTYVWDDPWVAPLIEDPSEARRLLAELQEQGFTHVLLDTGEMDRLERGQGLYGYLSRESGRAGIEAILRTLPMEVEANGVYLFRVPEATAGTSD